MSCPKQLGHRLLVVTNCGDQQFFPVTKSTVEAVADVSRLVDDILHRGGGITVPPKYLHGVGQGGLQIEFSQARHCFRIIVL